MMVSKYQLLSLWAAITATLLAPTSAFQSLHRPMIRPVSPCIRSIQGSGMPSLKATSFSSTHEDEEDASTAASSMTDLTTSIPMEQHHSMEHEASKWWKPSLSSTSKYVAATTAVAVATALVVGQPTAAWASGAGVAITAQTSEWWASIVETGFYQAFSLVFVSEIGDKTFFIAGLLAMKTSKFVSFLGSIGALAVMTVLSVLIGQIFHAVPSGFADGIPLDDVAAVLAFAFFGFKTLKEALDMEEGESAMDEELADAEEAVDESKAIKEVTKFGQLASIFGLVFAAEFGDRSFLSTIALSAAQNPFSVAAGGIAAHAVATGIAVSGGSYIAKYISEKVIGIIGGTLFLVFALTTALGIF
uniref:GDT1 family protein n=1 Tax=Entomoneis paludosa TaxID=265537 RepID=A0A7S2Y4R4_9STRA|mmetsp:Transcript_17627/g.36506  ORF Transcript_17627/g.36506 Transcript_17627/m.36506 type:complete len:360 (+) Transcript_17627:121-1200(+)